MKKKNIHRNKDFGSSKRRATRVRKIDPSFYYGEDDYVSKVIVSSRNGVLDGYNRLKICHKLGIEPKISIRNFDDVEQEKLFVIECDLQRRHLNAFQRTELALKLKPILQGIAKKNESLSGKAALALTRKFVGIDKHPERFKDTRDTQQWLLLYQYRYPEPKFK